MQLLMGQITGKNKSATTKMTDSSGAVVDISANGGDIPPFHARPDTLNEGATWSAIPARIAPMWPNLTPLDITIVVSPTFVPVPIAKVPKDRIVVDETEFMFGDYDSSRIIDASFNVPKEVQNNGTLWGHFYIGTSGSNLDPATPGFDPSKAFHFVHPLTQYIAQKKIRKTKNLLATSEADDEVRFTRVRAHWHIFNIYTARRRCSKWADH